LDLKREAAMFGRFLELAIATEDIAASVQFYERLGFAQLLTSDAWPHRYGVLSDGRIHLGLHECALPSPSVCFVLPELVQARARLVAAHMEPELARLGEDQLHELRLRDPAGHAIRLLEARTYSPGAPANGESVCGYFSHLSLPESDFELARSFWERAGFVALSEIDEPYPHLPLTSDRLDLAFHRRRTFDAPLLVFECADLDQRRARLQGLDIPLSSELPRGVEPSDSVLIEAPEGTLLWILGIGG
jgi:catechol 2,3-dioxygenase-like lactoylglutathione lyase family enzyme